MIDRLLDIWLKFYDLIIGAVVVGMLVVIVVGLLHWLYERMKAD
jgi:hypothetical protein